MFSEEVRKHVTEQEETDMGRAGRQELRDGRNLEQSQSWSNPQSFRVSTASTTFFITGAELLALRKDNNRRLE